MKHIVMGASLITASVMLAPAAQAQSTVLRTEIHMVTSPSEADLNTNLTAAKKEPILVTYAQSPRAVRLDGDSAIGVVASKRDIKAGEILFGRYDDGQWTYCAIDKPNATGQVMDAIIGGIFTGGLSLLDGPAKFIQCLHDADKDGVFETAWSGGETQTENAFLAYNLSKTTLAEPVSYSKVDYKEGPAMPVEITWSKNKKSGTLSFQTVIGDLSVGTKTISVPAPGADPEIVEIQGAKFEVLSYDPVAESLSYRILSNTSRQYLRLPATLTITTNYVYY